MWNMWLPMMEMKSRYSSLVLGLLSKDKAYKHLLNPLMNCFSMSLTLFVDKAVFFLFISLCACFYLTFILSLRLVESWYS